MIISLDTVKDKGGKYLVSGINVLPVSSGKGRRIILADMGEITTSKIKNGSNNQLVIKGTNGSDILLEAYSCSPGQLESCGQKIYSSICLNDGSIDEDDYDRHEDVTLTLNRILNISSNDPLTVAASKNKTNVPQGEGIKADLEKQMYYQKRELELQTRKKAATARKEKFMKESGGLKYTALAMSKM